MQRPSSTRFPDRRVAHEPSYAGPLRRAEDKTYLDERQKAHEKGLLIVRIAMWSIGGMVLVLGMYLVTHLGAR